MPKMVKFRLNRECREIAVNVERVLYVCHYETGASVLHFGKDCFVRVQGDLAEVSRLLEAATDDAEPAAPETRQAARPGVN